MTHPAEQDILRIVDHGVGAVFLQVDHDGSMLVLAHEYTGRNREGQVFTTLRMPFGKSRTDESVRATLNREVVEEVAADPTDFDLLRPAVR